MVRLLLAGILLSAPGCSKPDDPVKETGDSAVAPTFCERLGLETRAFEDAEPGEALYAVAADFTVDTLDGPWTFSEHYTGCESVLVIQDAPQQTQGWPRALWSRDIDAFFGLLPPNTRVLFVSVERESADRAAVLEQMRADVDETLADLGEAGAAFADRVHYLSDRAGKIDGWLGDVLKSPGWGVGIDRFQRIRYIGSYADSTRYDQDMGWFEPNLSMAANEARYYNFEAERAAALEADGATVVPIFTGERVAGNVYVDVDLPSESELAAFDTLALDLTMACEGEGEYGYCPAWDYMAYVYRCSVEAAENTDTATACQPHVPASDGVEEIAADTLECSCDAPGGLVETTTQTCNADGTGFDDCACSCDTEIGRWITTYHREGRWVHDVSAILPYVDDGGSQRYRFNTTGPYELTMDMRFSNGDKEARPQEILPLFTGGTINPDYNTNHPPVTVSIPADATKVELATVISGHGMNDPGNCAEFCNITHHFDIGGQGEIERSFPEAGAGLDCMDKVAEGTVPNQYGTWWYGRNGWCPGKDVPTVATDITDWVTPGTDATISYEALFNGSDYTGSASIRMRSYAVISRATP